MAFTDQNKADAYLFFVLAFNAAPGSVYGGQIVEAYNAGLTTQQIVNNYTTKEQFTKLYPETQTDAEFAAALVANVVGNTATDAVKAKAEADIVAALTAGLKKGDVIVNVLGNLSKMDVANADWGTTVALINNKIAVAKALTEGSHALNTSDVDLLQGPLKLVTENPESVQTALNAAGSLGSKLEALTSANKAVADFAEALDLDADGEADGSTSATVQTDVDNNVAAKAGDVTAKVAGWNVANTAAQNAALVASAKANADAGVATAQENLATAKSDATAGGVTAANISQYKALVANVDATATAANEAQATLDGALAKLNTLGGGSLTQGPTGEVAGFIVLDGTTLKVDASVTDAAQKAAATALISAFNADKAADTAALTATTAKSNFENQLTAPKVTLITHVTDAEDDLATAQKVSPAIDTVLAAYAEAKATQTELKGLTDAVAAAEKAFTDAGLSLPVEVAPSLVATAGDDTYVVGDVAGSISGFGVLGNDNIFVGSSYVLNASGDLTKGNDSALEVFFKSNGADTDVYVEQKAFGSSTTGGADLIKITLTGVTADQLVLKDGFITVAA